MRRYAPLLTALVILVGAVFLFFQFGPKANNTPAPPPASTVVPTPSGPAHLKILVTGDKVAWLTDERTKQVLLDNNMVVDFQESTSLKMYEKMKDGDVEGIAGLWASNEITLQKMHDLDEEAKKDPSLGKRATFTSYHPTTFNTVLVMYAWDKAVDPLIKAGWVEKVGNYYYVRDLQPIDDLPLQNVKWSDPRLSSAFPSGFFHISSPDAFQGDAGMIWAGLIANVQLQSHGQITQTPETITPILPEINRILGTGSFQQPDAQALFESLFNSPNSSQIVVGYESQLYEFIAKHPEGQQLVKDHLRIIYMPQEYWSSNPFIALPHRDANGKEVVDAIDYASKFGSLIQNNTPNASPELFEIACSHGYRVSTSCVQKHPEVFAAWGMPESTDLPSPTGVPNSVILQMILDSTVLKKTP